MSSVLLTPMQVRALSAILEEPGDAPATLRDAGELLAAGLPIMDEDTVEFRQGDYFVQISRDGETL